MEGGLHSMSATQSTHRGIAEQEDQQSRASVARSVQARSRQGLDTGPHTIPKTGLPEVYRLDTSDVETSCSEENQLDTSRIGTNSMAVERGVPLTVEGYVLPASGVAHDIAIEL